MIERSDVVVAQYEQLHEMRREYNRFIFQAPTIVVAIIGGAVALVGDDLLLDWAVLEEYAALLLIVAAFTLVMGYWALRSRLLLRGLEVTLKEFERSNGFVDMRAYPSDLSADLPLWQRLPSTLFIVLYIMAVGILFGIAGILGIFLLLFG
jgi:hypothetical protein